MILRATARCISVAHNRCVALPRASVCGWASVLVTAVIVSPLLKPEAGSRTPEVKNGNLQMVISCVRPASVLPASGVVSRHPVRPRLTIPFGRHLLRLRPELDRPARPVIISQLQTATHSTRRTRTAPAAPARRHSRRPSRPARAPSHAPPRNCAASVNTLAAFPYGDAFSTRNASSTLDARMITSTGPEDFLLGGSSYPVTWSRIVGPSQYPFSRPTTDALRRLSTRIFAPRPRPLLYNGESGPWTAARRSPARYPAPGPSRAL